jgi:hypothetical protein
VLLRALWLRWVRGCLGGLSDTRPFLKCRTERVVLSVGGVGGGAALLARGCAPVRSRSESAFPRASSRLHSTPLQHTHARTRATASTAARAQAQQPALETSDAHYAPGARLRKGTSSTKPSEFGAVRARARPGCEGGRTRPDSLRVTRHGAVTVTRRGAALPAAPA